MTTVERPTPNPEDDPPFVCHLVPSVDQPHRSCLYKMHPPESVRNGKVIVRRESDRKNYQEYRVFDVIDADHSLLNFVKRGSRPMKNTSGVDSLDGALVYYKHHEIIPGDNPRKIFFDIDIEESKLTNNTLNGTAASVVGTVISVVRDDLVAKGHKFDPPVNLRIYTSHDEKKRSFHLVFPGFHFQNHDDQKGWWDSLLVDETIPMTVRRELRQHMLDGFIDTAVWSSNHNLRMLHSSKDGRKKILQRTMNLDGRTYEVRLRNTLCTLEEHIPLWELRESLVTDIRCGYDNSITMPEYIRETPVYNEIANVHYQALVDLVMKIYVDDGGHPIFNEEKCEQRSTFVHIPNPGGYMCRVGWRVHERQDAIAYIKRVKDEARGFFSCCRKCGSLDLGSLGKWGKEFYSISPVTKGASSMSNTSCSTEVSDEPPLHNDELTFLWLMKKSGLTLGPLSILKMGEDLVKAGPKEGGLAEIIYGLIKIDFICLDSKAAYTFNYTNRTWKKTSGEDLSMYLGNHIVMTADFIETHYVPTVLERLEKAVDKEKLKIQKELASVNRLVVKLHSTAGQKNIAMQLRRLGSSSNLRDKAEIERSFRSINAWLPFRNNLNVNVYTGEVRERVHEDWMTGCCAVDWDADSEKMAEAEAFFRKICYGDDPKKKYNDLLVILLLAMSGINLYRYMFLLLGGGSNGKSVLMKVFRAAMGEFYLNVDKSVITVNRNQSKSNHSGFAMSMEGKRSIVADDNLTPHDTLDAGKIREYSTPGNAMDTRAAYSGQTSQMDLTGVWLFVFNHNKIPKGLSDDPALMNRIRAWTAEAIFMPQDEFDVLSDEKKKSGRYFLADPGIDDKMKAPEMLSAVMAVIIRDGGLAYRDRLTRGFPYPLDDEQRNLLETVAPVDPVKIWFEIIAKPSRETNISLDALAVLYGEDFRTVISTKQMRPILVGANIVGLTTGVRVGRMNHRSQDKRRVTCVLDYDFSGQTYREEEVSEIYSRASSSGSSTPVPNISNDMLDLTGRL